MEELKNERENCINKSRFCLMVDLTMMYKPYTGVGSRNTPKSVLEHMEYLAHHLASHGFTLRSGGAKGADQAFEEGCDRARGNKEIYLPWKGFEGSDSKLFKPSQGAHTVSELYHPNYLRLSQGARKLQARNVHQVLGKNLDSKSICVICWTKQGKGEGGTGQAIRIANGNSIPVLDLGKYKEDKSSLLEATNEFFNLLNRIK